MLVVLIESILDLKSANFRDRTLLRAQNHLNFIYDSLKSYSTQQELSNTMKKLEELVDYIENPEIDFASIKPPPTNENTKGRKRGPRSIQERLKIAADAHEEKLQTQIKTQEKETKKKKNMKRKRDRLK